VIAEDRTPTEELPLVSIRGPRPVAGDAASRFLALVEAVRRHEQTTSQPGVPKRPRDHALYRRLDSLEHPS
jgi:hypothetical protein